MSKLLLIASNLLSGEHISNFMNNSMKIYQITSDKLFDLIETEDINKDGLMVLEKIFDNIEYLLKAGITVNLDGYLSLQEAHDDLQSIHLKYIKSTTGGRELKEVLADFRGNNSNVAFPLSNIEINLIERQFLQIKSFEKELENLSNSQLSSLIKNIKMELSYTNKKTSQKLKEENICKLIAVANNAFMQYLNIYPHNIQILAVLGILLPRGDFKGRLAQIRTGEGKSTIVALLTLILACQGKCVDIITSTEYLAKRDEKKYKQFLDFFGVTTSNICNADIKPEDFAGQIIYGTNYNFEFSILFDKLYKTENRVLYNNKQSMRPSQVVIVDEVDNMLVDKALNSARISYQGNKDLITVYPVIYDYIRETCKLRRPNSIIIEQCKKLVKDYNIADIRLSQFVESAYKACFEQQLNVHYCIKKVDDNDNSQENMLGVVIIDQDTGRLCDGSRWQHGLHQFLEYKHGLPIKEETLTLGALSHPAFFGYYEEIYGVTGTIGTKIERSEIADIYKLTTFDVPTYKPTLRKQLDTIICNDDNEFNQIILNEVKHMLSSDRPCLILCASIEKSNAIYKLVKHSIDNVYLQLLNDVQCEDEDFIVSSAGNNAAVTIATNAAGRGTDIALSLDAIKHGGLHVLFTFFPSDERIEAQGAGRAGRQGNHGSYRVVVPHNDDLLMLVKNKKLLANYLNPAILKEKDLHDYRNERIEQLSKHRREHSAINLVQHSILEKFCNWYHIQSLSLNFNKHVILSKWADFYSNLENIKLPVMDSNHIEGNISQKSLVEYEIQLNKLFADFIPLLNESKN
jgi:preprotein translocase subunit SecA